jgi:uncharacterized protein (TIGR02444 family)
MAPLEIDNPFWRFSLRVYGTPGVADECLEVQDTIGVDVNVLLYVAWLGVTRGVALDDAHVRRIETAVAAWSTGVVQPLRSVRRGLKQSPDIANAEVQALRRRVASVELQSEQIEQAMLYRLADEIGPPVAEPDIAVRRNIAAVLASRGAEAGAFPLLKLIAAAGAAAD